MSPQQETLFPPYLAVGSRGPAVALLQALLKVLDFDENDAIFVDGDYDEDTAEVVRKLQEHLRVGQSGTFDRATRDAFHEEFQGLDLSEIPADAFR